MRRALLLILVLAGCGAAEEPLTFDAETLQEGDIIDGIHATAVDFRRAPGDSMWIGHATFVGEITVSGRYAAHFDCTDAPEICQPCFYPDSTSADRLPRLEHDERHAWFCFSNPEAAEDALGEPPARRPRPTGIQQQNQYIETEGEERTIVIDRYNYVYTRSDVHNEAEFVHAEQN